MPLSTVSALLARIGLGRLGRLGLEPAVRYERSRPGELIHIDVKKLGRIEGGAGKRVAGSPPALQPAAHRRRRPPTPHGRLGVRARRRRRLHPPGLRRGAPRRESPQPRSASCAAPSRSSPATASRVERLLTDNGSAYRAAVHALACRAARHPPPPHPPLPPADQRQSRTLHPHPARRLGLRRDLRSQPRTHRALDGWLWHYNHRRRHSALGHQPPTNRTNLLGYTAGAARAPTRRAGARRGGAGLGNSKCATMRRASAGSSFSIAASRCSRSGSGWRSCRRSQRSRLTLAARLTGSRPILPPAVR